MYIYIYMYVGDVDTNKTWSFPSESPNVMKETFRVPSEKCRDRTLKLFLLSSRHSFRHGLFFRKLLPIGHSAAQLSFSEQSSR